MWLKNTTEAKAVFEQVLALEPNDAVAKDRLASMPAYERMNSGSAQVSNAVSSFLLPLTYIPAIAMRDSIALQSSGFIDKSGKFAYHKLNAIRDRNYSNGLCLTHDHFVNRKGDTVGGAFIEAEDFSEGLAAVRDQNHWGYLNTSGALSISPVLEDAQKFHEGVAPAKQGGHWGFLDKNGRWVVEPKFDGAIPFAGGLAAVCIGDKVGYIDHQGSVVIPLRFDLAFSFSDGLAVVCNLEGPLHKQHQYCIDRTGKVVFDLTKVRQQLEKTSEFPERIDCGSSPDKLEPHETIYLRSSHSIDFRTQKWRYREGLMLIECGNRYGYLDKQGKLAILCKFDDATSFNEGLACVSSDKRTSYGYIDKTGRLVIKPQFKYARDFSEGLAGVTTLDGKNGGFIDHSGKLVLPMKGGFCGDFHEGLAPVGEGVDYL